MRVSPSNSNSIQASDLTSTDKTEKTEKTRKTDKSEAAEKSAKSGASANAAASTKTELSAKGREMAQAKAAASDAPDVREEKIAELKRRIAAGNYSVDSNAVADRMVDDHLRSGIG
jgi:negative regulator of flagellin synthesis FlgM